MTSSIKIDIHVRDNGQEIGYRPNSPVRKLPDGTAGIVVSGLVYALYEDHSIDLAEEGTPKADCPEFFRPGEDLVYAEESEAEDWWFFEETRWRSYLAFDGSEAFAERLNAAFEDEGLSDGYRESFRPAKNGHFYDYFIRLPSHVDEADVRRIIGEVSAKEPVQDPDEAGAKLLRLIVEQFGGLQNFAAHLTKIISSKAQLEEEVEDLRDTDLRQREDLEALKGELQREREARRRLSAQTGTLEAERDRLQTELKASRDTARHADVSWDDLKSQEIDRLSAEGAVIREERDLLQLEVEDLKAEMKNTYEKVRSLETELEIHRAEQRPTEVLPIEHSRSSKKEKQILNDFLSGAFPRLDLQDSDLKALLRDFGSISGCARVMLDLQEGRDPPHLNSWHDMKGVFEVSNISTGIKGRERMGRIYFRKSSESGKIEIAVQVKSGDGKQQDKFVNQRFP